jgi:leucyl-tRNA synthetase
MNMEAASSIAASASGLKDIEFGDDAKALRREIHTVLKQVDYDYQRMQYNTVVSGAMKMLNALESFATALDTCVSSLPPERALAARGGPSPLDFKASDSAGGQVALVEGFGILLRCLYPATPHIAHGLWSQLGYAGVLGDLLDAPWPQVDPAAMVQSEVDLVLQVNGKLRGNVRVPAKADKAEIERLALASDAFAAHSGGARPKRVVVVPGRLVNVVV